MSGLPAPKPPDEATQIRILSEQLDEARSWARHGYEIGQRSLLWSDYGTAPSWLTEGWPASFETDPTTKLLCQLDGLLLHYRYRRPPPGTDHCDLLDAAWGVIANAYGGNWDQADDVWRGAAERWRDNWHELLTQHCARDAGQT